MEKQILQIKKRNGSVVPFDPEKITEAIFKAAEAVGGSNKAEAMRLTDKVIKMLHIEALEQEGEFIPDVENVQDMVEKVLIEEGHAKTAKHYILYRQERAKARLEKVRMNADTKMMDIKERLPYGLTDDPIEDMFNHKSKLSQLLSQEQLQTYKNLLRMLRQMQKQKVIPTHSENNYLGDNLLASDIYSRKYYVKDLEGRHIETCPEDVFARIAAFLAAVEEIEEKREHYAINFYNHLYHGHFLPGGRVITGAGDLYRLKTLANCFVSIIEGDNIEAIYKTAYECARTYSYGGGIGVDVTPLRPRNSVVHNASDFSTGSVSFMELYSLTTGLIGQSGRRGALMLTLDVKHPDVLDFINVKQIPNWVTRQIVDQCSWSGLFSKEQLQEIGRQVRENTQVRFANVSLKMSDEFMAAVEEQNKYSTQTICIYKRKHDDIPTKIKQGEITYSMGIPAKDISNYALLEAVESISDLNKFLKPFGISVTEEQLNNEKKRNIFGDYSIKTTEGDLVIHYAGDFLLYFNSNQTGEVKRLVKAKDIWNPFVASNYKTAEPGLMFWSTMTKYSPTNYIGRPIISTNPCVAADSLVATELGLERIDNIQAENIVVDVRTESGSLMQYGSKLVKPSNRLMTGYKECYTLETKAGYEVTATPDHKILTADGWKEMKDITEEDYIFIQSGEGKFNMNAQLPFEIKNKIKGKNGREYQLHLPTLWSRELGLLLGWLIGDGFINKSCNKTGLVFAEEDEEARKVIEPILRSYCNNKVTLLKHPNGCLQVRSGSKYVADFFRKLGVKDSGEGREREVPACLFTATEEAVLGFLEGILSSDGTIALGSKSRNYVRLNSSSLKLLKQVQLLLLNLGMKSTVYDRSTNAKIFRYTNVKGEIIKYKTSGINYELNISKENVAKLINRIVFLQTKNKNKAEMLHKFEFYKETFVDKVKSKNYAGKKEVWDITEPETHSFIANGIVVHNCGEIPLQDGGACNLGSLNLSRFVNNGYMQDAAIDWDLLKTTTHDFIRMLDNTITWNEQLNPLEKQRIAAAETRRLGLGVMGIADMFNQLSIGYDSEEGIVLIEKIMQFIADEAYRASAMLAKEKTPALLWDREAYCKGPFFREFISEEVQQLVREQGLRNLALLSIAPTGTISNAVLGFVGENNKYYVGVSSGVEPIFALFYRRRSETLNKEESSKFYNVFHPTIQAYIDMKNLREQVSNVEDSEQLRKVLPVSFFRTSHFIEPLQRVRIQGVCQKYIDHSISSTVNLPESIKPETVSEIYFEAWKKGLKGITIYRDGSRYPILSVATQQSEFQKIKTKTFKIVTNDKELLLKGDEVFSLDDGSLTTVFHAMAMGSKIPINEVDIAAALTNNTASPSTTATKTSAPNAEACKIEFKDGKIVKTCEE